MADQKGLRTIGFGFATITAAVMLIAALMVADATRGTPDQGEPPQTASVTAAA
ncbi:MAG: hypothetical protein WDO17_06080 [Alphaproteobacteria bacterium]